MHTYSAIFKSFACLNGKTKNGKTVFNKRTGSVVHSIPKLEPRQLAMRRRFPHSPKYLQNWND
jgi:hypothetical protein